MSYERYVPDNERDLFSALKELHKGRYVLSFLVRGNRFEVDLDFRANIHRGDFYMPIRNNKIKDALDLAHSLFRQPPTESEARSLFACVDPHGL